MMMIVHVQCSCSLYLGQYPTDDFYGDPPLSSFLKGYPSCHEIHYKNQHEKTPLFPTIPWKAPTTVGWTCSGNRRPGCFSSQAAPVDIS